MNETFVCTKCAEYITNEDYAVSGKYIYCDYCRECFEDDKKEPFLNWHELD